MVKYSPAPLDRTFAALADPTRRALLDRLGAEPELSVSALAAPFALSLPAVLKHLDVLGDAGLVRRTKVGRTVLCRLEAGPMEQAMAWLAHYERFWTDGLDRLAALVEDDPCSTDPTPPAPASPSSAGSGRRRPRSTRRGPGRNG
jgi:DNA-binding transcriptional ArsR family regulator